MPFFREKPVMIEARQWTGLNSIDLLNWIGSDARTYGTAWLIIPTLEGDHSVLLGDWIIKGEKGDFYPCKPVLFEMTYEVNF
jgi:hypothetical protein